MIDYVRLVLSAFRQAWLVLRNRPNVTCDIRHVSGWKWYPDSVHDDQGKVIAEGIHIQGSIEFILANEGPVNTTIKGIHVEVKQRRDIPCRLNYESLCVDERIENRIMIGARGTWGPISLQFGGFWLGVYELAEHPNAELVVEPVAQQPIRTKAYLHFF